MESADNETSGGIPFNQYRLSWVAYVRAVVVFFFLSALAVALGALNQSLSVVAVLAALAIFAYQVLYLRSTGGQTAEREAEPKQPQRQEQGRAKPGDEQTR